ncbi:hypothetical protein BaRGS_00020099 [Batillaria attramentaria]|uniref:Secreted protein n=1 Tax=Batillaria attramentaria TaxID=370345 RepID=A0ABD0KNZ6_9CAEN
MRGLRLSIRYLLVACACHPLHSHLLLYLARAFTLKDFPYRQGHFENKVIVFYKSDIFHVVIVVYKSDILHVVIVFYKTSHGEYQMTFTSRHRIEADTCVSCLSKPLDEVTSAAFQFTDGSRQPLFPIIRPP